MKLKPKFLLSFLLIASIPLLASMGVTLVQSTNQTRSMTLNIVQGNLEAGAANLSGYFDSRKAEIAAYAQSPLFKTMDFKRISPFLHSESKRPFQRWQCPLRSAESSHFPWQRSSLSWSRTPPVPFGRAWSYSRPAFAGSR